MFQLRICPLKYISFNPATTIISSELHIVLKNIQPHRPRINIILRIKLTTLHLYKIILVRITGFPLAVYPIFLWNFFSRHLLISCYEFEQEKKQRWIKRDFYPWISSSSIRLTGLWVPYKVECHIFYECRYRKLEWFTLVAQKFSDKACLESWLMFQHLLWSRNFKTRKGCYLFFQRSRISTLAAP